MFVCIRNGHRIAATFRRFYNVLSAARLVAFCLVLCWSLAALGATPTAQIHLGTGSDSGVYYPLGRGLERLVEEAFPTVDVVVHSTRGSHENAIQLMNGNLDLAFMQNDTAYHLWTGDGEYALPFKQLVVIASLYTEYVQILSQRRVRSLSDLRGTFEPVVVTGSSRVTASARQEELPEKGQNLGTILLKAAGFTQLDLVDERLSFRDARSAMLGHSNAAVDAVFVTAGIPTPLITEEDEFGRSLLNSSYFVPIDSHLAMRAIHESPYLVFTTIPREAYGLPESVNTLGVRALLVARRGFEQDRRLDGAVARQFVRKLTEIVFTRTDVLKSEHGVTGTDITGLDIDVKEAGRAGVRDPRRGTPLIPFHPQAETYYQVVGVWRRPVSEYYRTACIVVVIIAALILLIRRGSVLRRVLKRHLQAKLLVIFFCYYCIGAIAMFFFERRENDHFQSLAESFWSITIYILSGFEDRPPVTWGGRIMSVFVFVLSVGFAGAVAGRFAAAFLRKESERMPEQISEHIVICSWNSGGAKVVSELRTPGAAPRARIVILCDRRDAETHSQRIVHHERVHLVLKNPLDDGALEEARAHCAKTVIVLAGEGSQHPDAESAMIVLAVRRLSRDSRPHMIVEARDHANKDRLRDAGADEVICAADMGMGLIAHCAVNKQLSGLYEDLLTYSQGGNEIYIIEGNRYPSAFIGMTFKECSMRLSGDTSASAPVLLIGLQRDGKTVMNPKGGPGSGHHQEEPRIAAGDALVVMAYSLPDLTAPTRIADDLGDRRM